MRTLELLEDAHEEIKMLHEALAEHKSALSVHVWREDQLANKRRKVVPKKKKSETARAVDANVKASSKFLPDICCSLATSYSGWHNANCWMLAILNKTPHQCPDGKGIIY